jgi:hypothetical protein
MPYVEDIKSAMGPYCRHTVLESTVSASSSSSSFFLYAPGPIHPSFWESQKRWMDPPDTKIWVLSCMLWACRIGLKICVWAAPRWPDTSWLGNRAVKGKKLTTHCKYKPWLHEVSNYTKIQKTFEPSRNIDRNPGIVKITTIPGLRSMYPDYFWTVIVDKLSKSVILLSEPDCTSRQSSWNQTVELAFSWNWNRNLRLIFTQAV